MKHVMLALALAAAVATAAAQSRDGNARSRDIYVTVLDGKGAPVPGLGIADFAVREDGATREVLKVEPATAPLDVMVLIDDSQAAERAIQSLREGLTAFVDKLAGKAGIGLVTVGERPTSLTEHTTNVAVLKKGISRIFSRPGAGSYLLDGIVDTSKGLQKREAKRAHIVVITMEAVEFSNLQYQSVLTQLNASGATLHVLSIGQPSADMGDESRNRGLTIAEGTAQTGGRRDQVLSEMGIPDKLRQVADDLLNEYVVTYGRPDALIPPTKVQVTTTRPGVTVRARTRLAGR